MFSPQDMTSSVIGGLLVNVCGFAREESTAEGVERAERGYNGTEASQSSSNNGSSSFSDLRRGRRVDRSARYVVRERSGSGYESGGERSRTWCAY